jgi:hypothetical protein
VLVDPAIPRSTEWVNVGTAYRGYIVTGFDARSEALLLARDGIVTRLLLKAGRSVDVSAAPVGVADDPVGRTLRAELIPAQQKLSEARRVLLKLVTERGNFDTPPTDPIAAADRNGLRLSDPEVAKAHREVRELQEVTSRLSRQIAVHMRTLQNKGTEAKKSGVPHPVLP